MLNIGITGQSGFIGTHLYNTLSLSRDDFRLVDYERDYFNKAEKLNNFVEKCDCIIHLAAMNRHGDDSVLYETNVGLVEKLITAMEATESTPHVIFSSSIQEERDNVYGRSKKRGNELLMEWAKENDAPYSGLVIPNVFGPFGDPYYNSVVATFSHQLTHDERPSIDVDANMDLIYVGELVQHILKHIRSSADKSNNEQRTIEIPHTASISVSGLLEKLKSYKEYYLKKGIIPDLSTSFDRNLFNTFRGYMDHQHHFPVQYEKHSDDRGSFVETMRAETAGQFSFSTTKPGIRRGDHYHTRKVERFAVIKGEALIEMRQIGTEEILSFKISGDKPGYVDMPIWYTHNIKNIGDSELYTLFWINEFYDPEDADTYYEEV